MTSENHTLGCKAAWAIRQQAAAAYERTWEAHQALQVALENVLAACGKAEFAARMTWQAYQQEHVECVKLGKEDDNGYRNKAYLEM